MLSTSTELIRNFVAVSNELINGYVNLADFFAAYTALDLLTEEEFQPILKELAAKGIDLYLVLSIVTGLFIRLPKRHFKSLEGSLDREEGRMLLKSESRSCGRLLPHFQKIADRVSSRYVESCLISMDSPLYSNNKFYVN